MKVISVFLIMTLIISGCGNDTQKQDFFVTSKPIEILDPVHQQDIINWESPEEDAEQEETRIELVKALNKKMEETPELEFKTFDKIPDEDKNASLVPKEVKTPVLPKTDKETKPVDQPKVENEKEKPEVKNEDKKDIRVSLEGRASVYYLPVLDEVRKCSADKMVHMRDPQGKILAHLCRNEILNCALQGSCYFLTAKDILLFAYSGKAKVKLPKSDKVILEPRFKINLDLKDCPFGMGAGKTCLDPYRSIAADKKFHKRGDVVYLPLLDGQQLPNGEIHDGYFIVRDTGGVILGEGRFDFFIGFDDYRNHLFTRLNLSDKTKNHFTYYRVPEEEAEMIRKARAFPSIPNVKQLTTLGILKAQKKIVVTQSRTTVK